MFAIYKPSHASAVKRLRDPLLSTLDSRLSLNQYRRCYKRVPMQLVCLEQVVFKKFERQNACNKNHTMIITTDNACHAKI